jgi:hypothetical protein
MYEVEVREACGQLQSSAAKGMLRCAVGDVLRVPCLPRHLTPHVALLWAQTCDVNCPRSGWVMASSVEELPIYEFGVRFAASERGPCTPLGLQCVACSGEGSLPGSLEVLHVHPGSSAAVWNARCLATFPRNQIMPGDIVSWAFAPDQNIRGTSGRFGAIPLSHVLQSSSAAGPLLLRIVRLNRWHCSYGASWFPWTSAPPPPPPPVMP